MSKLKDISNYFTKEFNTTDVYKLCSDLNIPIRYDPLRNIYGHIINYNGCIPIITLNKNLKEWQKYIVLSHELAHFILHRDILANFKLHEDMDVHTKSSIYIDDPNLEYEATDFGLDILWPFGHISTDYLKKEVCEFIATMYPTKYRDDFIKYSIRNPPVLLCGKPMTDDDVVLLEQSIDNTIKFAKGLV